MAKEACTTFEVQAKQLLKLLSGKVYLGGTGGKQPSTGSQGPKQKKQKCSMAEAPDEPAAEK